MRSWEASRRLIESPNSMGKRIITFTSGRLLSYGLDPFRLLDNYTQTACRLFEKSNF